MHASDFSFWLIFATGLIISFLLWQLIGAIRDQSAKTAYLKWVHPDFDEPLILPPEMSMDQVVAVTKKPYLDRARLTCTVVFLTKEEFQNSR